MSLGSSCLICLPCVCMFGMFALFALCLVLFCSLEDQIVRFIRITNTHYAIMLVLKVSMDSLINVVVIIMCKIRQNGSITSIEPSNQPQ